MTDETSGTRRRSADAPAHTLEGRNKELIRRMYVELIERRELNRVDDFFAPDFVSHNQPPGFPPGVDGVRRFFSEFAHALADLTVTIDVELAEGDLVALRTTTRGMHRGTLFGIPPSGRRLDIDGTDIIRIEGERIVEHWGLTNTVGVIQQVDRLARLRWLAHHLLRRAR
jgi:predicted ester cyclase